jgi:ferredoxin
MKTMSVGMGLETHMHCLNGVFCQTCVVIIIMVTFRVLLYSFGLN